MRHGTVCLASVRMTLGHLRSVEDALQAGEISPEQAAATNQKSVSVARDGCTGATLAADAALDALAAAHIRPLHVGPLYHATTRANTSGGPSQATKVLSGIGQATSRHPVHTYTNGPQGVIDALSAAALYLEQLYPTETRHALITVGDTWAGAVFNRWSADTPYGDGAGALVLTTDQTDLFLLSTASRTDAVIGDLRDDDRRVWFVRDRLKNLLHDVATDALDDAGLQARDVTYLITPFGAGRPEREAIRPFTKIDDSTFAALDNRACQVGHLGAADLIAGLHHIERTAASLTSGDRILLLAHNGVDGAGAAVIQVR